VYPDRPGRHPNRVRVRRAAWPLVLLAALASLVFTAPRAAAYDHVGRVVRLDPRLDALIAPDAKLEQVATGFAWTEGPLWDARDGSLLFSDVPRNVILRWKERAGTTTFLARSGYTGSAEFAGREPGSNGLAFDPDGRLVRCQHGDRRIVRTEADGRTTVIAERYQGRRLNSPNDLVFASSGDLYFTDPPFGLPRAFDDPAKELPFQGVFRVRTDGTIVLLTAAVRAPNGIALSPDERTLYVSNADAAAPVWLAFPLEAGGLGLGRELADARAWARDGEGAPDGLEVDRHGNLFAAGPGGIHVLAPDGTRLGRIETGMKTGNVAWGEDGTVLYVAASGAILRMRTTTRGAR
jgi:gluconolactonase